MPPRFSTIVLSVCLLISLNTNCTAIDRCNEFVDKRQYSLDIEACTERIIKGNPESIDYYNRGTAYLNTGQHIRAIDDFNTSIRMAPDFFAAYSNRGSAYAASGELQKV
jgi:tetratricopeptide (TPR) repeat protein